MKFKIVLSLVILSTLVGCSIKKRTYRDGYYVSWHHKKNDAAVVKNREQTSDIPRQNKKNDVAVDKPLAAENNELATLGEQLPFKAIQKPKITVLNNNSECGDIITFRKGSEVKAKVLEVTETQIKYKRCDNPDGPLITVSKNDVYSIKYVNGILEHFDRTVPDYKNKSGAEKEIHPLAYVTLGCTIAIVVLNVFALIAALIVGTIAKQKILAEPDKYEGLDMVKICMTICWVLLILGLILTFIILALLLSI